MAKESDNQKKEPTKVISAEVPEWIHAEAKAKAARERRPLQEIVREMVEAWLKDQSN